MSANSKQIGGTHYQGAIQPWDFITSNNLGYLEGTAVKYLARWRKKNGIEDLRKAIHFIEKLIEVETRHSTHHIPVREWLASMESSQYRSFYNGDSTRLRNVYDVANETRDPVAVPSGELNDLVILRADNV